ncbi:MAG TPA: class IV adenylate cyclase [Candidatus Polarisedimenticolaceae bacterium]|nr:class IV adenylate cyclase [Candidatus Polarisedimenticolaceae bacterium]
MGKSSRENEIKLAFPSAGLAREALERAGARLSIPRRFEDNVVYDRDGGALARSGRVLRVRRDGNRIVLTLKTPVEGTHVHKLKNEFETEVGDQGMLMRILAELGFAPAYRYQKYRTSFALDEVDAELDETPIGTFVELEGGPEAVDRAAASLGASPGDYIVSTYRELHEHDALLRGVPVGDLLMTEEA